MLRRGFYARSHSSLKPTISSILTVVAGCSVVACVVRVSFAFFPLIFLLESTPHKGKVRWEEKCVVREKAGYKSVSFGWVFVPEGCGDACVGDCDRKWSWGLSFLLIFHVQISIAGGRKIQSMLKTGVTFEIV